MKRTYLFFLLFISTMIFGCTSSIDMDPRGEIYHKISLSLPLTGSEQLLIGNAINLSTFKNGKDFTTSPFKIEANENYMLQVIISSIICRDITVDTYFKGKSFDKRTFRMGALEENSSAVIPCKDGEQQVINLVTPNK